MNLKLKQFIDVYIGRTILFFNLIAVRSLGLILKRNHSVSIEPKNILIIKILGLGSVIMASDSIYSLKNKYPNAKYILLCGKGVALGIEPLNLFDDILILNDKNIFVLFKSSISILIKTWKLKKLWIMDLEVYSVLTTLFASWTFAINRFGFQLDKTHFRNYLNTHNIYFNQFNMVSTNYQNLAKAMGVTDIIEYVFPLIMEVNNFKKNTIFINNTCSELGGELRKIPDNLLSEICNYLLKNTNYYINFVGAPSDYESINSFILKYNFNTTRVLNIAGKYNFSEYYHYLSNNGKLMISIDSAPLHIANKLKIPCVSLWGPINPLQRLSNIENTYYLKKSCSPCIHHTEFIPCGGNNICMKDMQLNDITKLIHNLI